jgi:hypothetical protein
VLSVETLTFSKLIVTRRRSVVVDISTAGAKLSLRIERAQFAERNKVEPHGIFYTKLLHFSKSPSVFSSYYCFSDSTKIFEPADMMSNYLQKRRSRSTVCDWSQSKAIRAARSKTIFLSRVLSKLWWHRATSCCSMQPHRTAARAWRRQTPVHLALHFCIAETACRWLRSVTVIQSPLYTRRGNSIMARRSRQHNSKQWILTLRIN